VILPVGSGYARLFSGKTGAVLSTVRAWSGESWFGLFVGGPGDLDQDGVPDLIISAGMILVYSTRNVSLTAEPHQLSLTTAGTQSMSIDVGAAYANHSYWVFGSYSGTRLGIPLGNLRLPLDYDAYTELTIQAPNSSVIPNSRGQLDASGRAAVSFQVPSGLPVMQAFTLHHACLVFDSRGNWVLASNPTWLRLQ
jgi:hypothetical protein